MSALSSKQVRFTSDNEETCKARDHEAEIEQRQPIDLASLLKENTSELGTLPKKKRKPKKKTKIQKLKTEKKKLIKELKNVQKGIKEDSDRKSSAEYTPYENRQRLARSTSEIHSKVKQLDEKLSVKTKVKREKIKKSYKTKIKTRTIKAGKQHHRLINMTSKLHDMKLNEDEIRDDIRKERSLSSLSSSTSRGCHSNTYDMISLDNDTAENWVAISDQPTCIEEEEKVEEFENTARDHETMSRVSVSSLEMARLNSSLSLTSGLSLEEKELKAEKLAKKYEFTRELRNIIHQHMISRSYSYSYSNIIPPYKHRKPKPMKTKQSYNRTIYEEKMNVLEYSKKQNKLPAVKP